MWDEAKGQDFTIGQKVGVIWRSTVNEKTEFRFKQAKISKLSSTSKGTTIYTTPKLFNFNFKIEDGEYLDYRNFSEGDYLMVNTPMLISDETAEYFEKLIKQWNETPPKSIWE